MPRAGRGVHSGERTLGTFATAQAHDVAAAGNLLRSRRYRRRWWAPSSARRAIWPSACLTAMEAALAAGGEEGPVHSAGLLIVRDVPWPVADLRVDWTDGDPIAELRQAVGDLQAAAGRLRHAGAEPDGSADLRRAGG